MSEPTNASPDGVRSDELDLDAIEVRANAATEGPWARNGLSDVEGSVATFHRVGLGPHVLDAIILTDTQRDADFIAHAREDVPALVAEVRRLRALIPHPDCNCGFGGQHDPDNPRCEANRP